MNKSVVNYLILMLVMFAFISCLSKQEQKASQGTCNSGYVFDPLTRSCKSGSIINTPPQTTLRIVTLLEDTYLNVVLTYDDPNNDYASSCTVSNLSSGIKSIGDCQCIGGFCTIGLLPDSNFTGLAQFEYNVSDGVGNSPSSRVRVVIEPVNDPPEVVLAIPDGGSSVFQEDGSKVFQLSYTDAEGGLATECDVTLPSGANAYVSGACTCNLEGKCSFTLSGSSNKYTSGAEYFTFRVKVADQWSTNQVSTSYTILSTNDLPQASNIVPTTTVTEDFRTGGTFTLYYSDPDGTDHPASGCGISDNEKVALASCTCPAGSTTCSLVLTYTGGQYLNKDTTQNNDDKFYLKYYFVDGDGGGNGPASDTYYLTVEPYNNQVTVTNSGIESASFSVDEDTELDLFSSSKTITIGEGGTYDEYVQSILIKVASSDEFIISPSKVTVLYDKNNDGDVSDSGEEISGSTDWRDLGDGSAQANSGPVSFKLTPETGQSGTVTITIYLKDSAGSDEVSFTFTVSVDEEFDLPSIKIHEMGEFYNKYNDAPGCDNTATTIYKEDCLRDTNPYATGANITPNKKGQIFLDYKANLRYVSTGISSASDWTPLRTACSITSSENEPGCLRYVSATDQFLNCTGSGSPATNSIKPTKTGSYYFDYTNNRCYKSNGTSSSSDWEIVSLYSDLSSSVCNYDVTTAPTPTSYTDAGTIYKNTTTNTCYVVSWDYATSTGSLNSFSTSCNVSKDSCNNGKNCIGSIPPRKNTIGSDNVTPDAKGKYYFDYTNNICYLSVGTSTDDWVIYGNDFPDLSGNQNSPLVARNLIVDEGGNSVEDSQKISMYFRFLTNLDEGVGNKKLFKCDASNDCAVKIYCNGQEITTGVLASRSGALEMKFDLHMAGANSTCVSTDDDFLKNVVIHFFPEQGQYGRSEIKMSLADTAGASETDYYYSLKVYPVATQQEGWKLIRSLGHKTTEDQTTALEKGYVQLKWDAFSMSGSSNDDSSPVIDPDISTSSYSSTTVSGYNIYRRMANEIFDYNRPLNSSPISASTREFIDNETNTNTIPGPPLPGTVYYYQVVAIDSIHSLNVVPNSSFISTARVIAPPNNLSFVHRWMVNKEVCSKLHKNTLEPGDIGGGDHHYRCLYSGPGETTSTYTYNNPYSDPRDGVNQLNISYYDIGQDMLVDRQEASCPYSDDCNGYYCVDIGSPENGVGNTGSVYYDRSSGRCYYKKSDNIWYEFDNSVSLVLSNNDIPQSVALGTMWAHLPPLVNIRQDRANSLCAQRGTAAIETSSGQLTNTNSYTLPSRKEQIGFSSWIDDGSLSDSTITELEQGLNLNASAKCNSTKANGLNGFTSASYPSSGDSYSMPGTDASNIRSVITGSTNTSSCISSFGLQDTIGNVSEWGSDRIFCFNKYQCSGVATSYAGRPCRPTTTNDITNGPCSVNGKYTNCIGDSDPSNYTAHYKGIIYYDKQNDKCYVSQKENTSGLYTDSTNNAWKLMSSYSTDPTFCPVTLNTVETGCAINDIKVNCVGNTPPTPTPLKSDSYFFDYGSKKCYKSTIGSWTTNSTSCPMALATAEPSCDSNKKYCFGSTPPTPTPVYDNKFYYDYSNSVCYKSSAGAWNSVSTASGEYSFGWPRPTTLNNNEDMQVDDTFYYVWALDGIKGPCILENGTCSSKITGWSLENASYSSSKFFFPLGLPMVNTFESLFPYSAIQSSLLTIGPSQGITIDQMHGDTFTVNSEDIYKTSSGNPTRCGAITSGGNYEDGTGAGRYNLKFWPCDEEITVYATPSTKGYTNPQVGFRCKISIPVDNTFYQE